MLGQTVKDPCIQGEFKHRSHKIRCSWTVTVALSCLLPQEFVFRSWCRSLLQGENWKLRQGLTHTFFKWLSYRAAYTAQWILWKTFPSPNSSHTACRVRVSNSDLGIPLKRKNSHAVLGSGPCNHTYMWSAISPNESPVFSRTSHPLKPCAASTKSKN